MEVLERNRQGGILFKSLFKDELFNIKGQGLYAWVNESQYKLMKNDGLDPIKFGQYGTNASEGSTPQNTIKSYVGITSEPVIILWAHKLTPKELQVGTALQIENMMKPLVGPKSLDGKSTEVFYTSIDKIKNAFSQIVYNIKEKDIYSPRERQQEAIDKIVKNFNTPNIKDFLLGAIMRFGKNFTFLNFIKQTAKVGDNILILTNKPGVFKSLDKDIKNHVYFENFNYILLRDIKGIINLKLPQDKINIIAVSKQLADNKVRCAEIRHFLNKTPFIASMFDECHSGTDTESFKALISGISIDFKVWTSGTPFKTMVAQGFLENNSYMYGYIEQQNDKRKGHLPDAVTLETRIISPPPTFSNNPHYTEEEGFTHDKLFAIDYTGEFIFGGEVKEYLQDILGLSSKKAKYSPYRICPGNLDHTIWLLPTNIKMVEAVGRMIENITTEYKVIVASGDNSKNIDDVHDAITLNSKTITLTNMRFIEGTTVEQWSGAFVMSNTESTEKYFQFIFRVATPSKGKDKAFIFDFSMERTFRKIFEFSHSHAMNTDNKDIQKVVREWLDNNNVYRSGDGPTFKLIDIEDILGEVQKGDYGSITLIKTISQYLKGNIDGIASSWSKLNTKKSIKKEDKFISNGTPKGKNFTQSNGKPRTKSEILMLDEAKANIAGVIASFPFIKFMEGLDTVEDIVSSLNDNLFYDYTGVSKIQFIQLMEIGKLDTRYINLYL